MNQGQTNSNCGIMQAYRGGEMSHDRRTIRNVDDEIYRIAPKTYDRGAMGRNARDEYGRDLREKRYLHNQMNQMADGGQVQGYAPGGPVWDFFKNVKDTVLQAIPGIATNALTGIVQYGLPAILMGADPKDALKYGAGAGIVSSLFNQPGVASGTKEEGDAYGSQEERIEAMKAAEIVGEGAPVYDPSGPGTGISPGYTDEQIDAFTKSGAGRTGLSGVDRRGAMESMVDVFTEPDKMGSIKQAFLPDSRAFDEKTDYIRQYGPLLGLGLGAAYLGGAFDPQKSEPPPDPWGGQTWQGLMRANPNAYRSAPTFVPRGNADGGAIKSFPRRNGSIRGPGTATSDDIPAMLSDGEFVMTAKSVLGAGQGDREEGMNKMYAAMHQLEGRA